MKTTVIHILSIGGADSICSRLQKLLQQIQQPRIELSQQNVNLFTDSRQTRTAFNLQPPEYNRQEYDLYIVRILPGDRQFLSLLSKIQQQHPTVPILAIVDSEQSGIDSLKFGASSYLQPAQIDAEKLQQFCSSILQQKRDREQNQTATETFPQLFDSIAVGIGQVSWKTGQFLLTNRKYQQILGYSPLQIHQRTWQSLTHSQDLPQTLDRINRLATGESNSFCQQKRYLHSNGTYINLWETVSLIRDGQGYPQFLVFALTRIKSESDANLQLSQLAEYIPGVILQYQTFGNQLDGRFTYLSPGIFDLYELETEAILNNPRLISSCIKPEDLPKFQQSLRTAITKKQKWSHQWRLVTPSGKIKWVEGITVPRQQGDDRWLWDGFLFDISDRKQAEAQLNYNAFYDCLTGLPNRALFRDRLQGALTWVQRQPETIFALLLLDLDRFKRINDSLGHQAGDEFLCQIATRLKQCLRSKDTIARLGGDEFAILLWDIDSLADAIDVAERLQTCLHEKWQVRGYDVSSSASIGITLSQYPLTKIPYAKTEDMMRDVDIAMYRAKYGGKGSYAIFDGTIYASTVSQLQLESELRQAIEQEQLYLHYQPIVSLRDRRLIGFESLLRWHHPQWGIISPSKFIPIAEESGLILSLGEWVMRNACQQMQQWQAHGLVNTEAIVSVNVSGRQFDKANFIDRIHQILQISGLSGKSLCIEVTENILIANSNEMNDCLHQLRQSGISMSVDDFGTGYSSLSRLHSFPIDTLKIDRSFVSEVETRTDNQAIIRTIMGLAASLQLQVVVEGVETENQFQYLQNLGCHYGQGYWLGRPLDNMAMELWLRDRDL